VSSVVKAMGAGEAEAETEFEPGVESVADPAE
jgi:hypothetical protein